MKKNIYYIALILLHAIFTSELTTGIIPDQFNMPLPSKHQPMPMPHNNKPLTVDDIFSGMSQEDIIKQVEEVQKFFESLSPEDQQALISMADKAFEDMPKEEQDSILGIANLIDPYISSEKPEAKLETVNTPKDIKKPKEIEINVDTDDMLQLKSMINSINNQIDEILQKAESSKESSEFINNKWDRKITFDSMKRQLLKLNDRRLLKKLVDKNSPDKDLHLTLTKGLQKLHTNISNANQKLDIQDSFGLTESKSLEHKYLQDIKGILMMFENNIDTIMPLLEKFFLKHEPEIIQIAKEYETKAKNASSFAQDASIKRGSAPAIPAQPKPQYNVPSYNTPSYGSPYQDSYNDRDYRSPSSYHAEPKSESSSSPSSMPSSSTSGSKSAKPDGAKKSDDKKDKEDDKKIKDNASPAYAKIIDTINDYTQTFNDNHAQKVSDFFKNTLAKYPSAIDPKQPGNQNEDNDWIFSRGNYKDKGFQKYSDMVRNQLSTELSAELYSAKKLIDNTTSNLSSATKDELQALLKNNSLQKIKTRLNTYKKDLDLAIDKIDEQFKKNANDGGGAKPAQGLHDPMSVQLYTSKHEEFMNFIKSKISDQLNELSAITGNLDGRIKRHMNKAK